jgi:hypothetical protein
MAIDPQMAADARATLVAVRPDLAAPVVATMLAQAYMESRWGRGSWMAGSNNWGSMQSTPAWAKKHAADPGYGVISYVDSHNNGASYAAGLRVLPTQLEGAREFATAVQAYAGVGAAIPSDLTQYATMLHRMPCGQPGGWYEGTGDNCVAQYASWVGGALPQVNAALAAADAKGLVGNANLARPDNLVSTAAHKVTWFVGDGGAGGGASGLEVALLCVGALSLMKWGT